MKIALDKIFEGKRVTIIGGGPSLSGFNYDRVVQPVIAVNYACHFIDSQMIVAIDPSWHKLNKEYLDNYSGFILTDRVGGHEKSICVELSLDCLLDFCIGSANLSGFLAIAAAFNLGARQVTLFGFDGGFDTEKPNFHKNGRVNMTTRNYERKNMWFEYFQNHNVLHVVDDNGSKIKFFRQVHIDQYHAGML